ncbi:MAG: hypothetical protein HDS03_02865 [Bacteroides sp.]|nr:hypothetical protein [Bacteroides sp.]
MKAKKTIMLNSCRLTICFFMGLFLFISCHKPQGNPLRPEAMELYSKSVRLMNLYSDSIANATDSASLFELQERFTSALTALNFKYPSETCLEISEGENDTLTNLTERIIFLKDSLLFRYAHPIEELDSLANDSIQNNSQDPSSN